MIAKAASMGSEAVEFQSKKTLAVGLGAETADVDNSPSLRVHPPKVSNNRICPDFCSFVKYYLLGFA